MLTPALHSPTTTLAPPSCAVCDLRWALRSSAANCRPLEAGGSRARRCVLPLCLACALAATPNLHCTTCTSRWLCDACRGVSQVLGTDFGAVPQASSVPLVVCGESGSGKTALVAAAFAAARRDCPVPGATLVCRFVSATPASSSGATGGFSVIVPLCCLRAACLRAACLRAACLRAACLRAACLRAACLRAACLRAACLRATCLRAACLRAACLRAACLRAACLRLRATSVPPLCRLRAHSFVQLRSRTPRRLALHCAAGTLMHSVCSQIALVYDCADVCAGRVPEDFGYARSLPSSVPLRGLLTATW
jgi:hypothetical protein